MVCPECVRLKQKFTEHKSKYRGRCPRCLKRDFKNVVREYQKLKKYYLTESVKDEIGNILMHPDKLQQILNLRAKIGKIARSLQNAKHHLMTDRIYLIAYRMTDAQFEGGHIDRIIKVSAPSYKQAITVIKKLYTECEPRKFSNFTLVNEQDNPKIISYPQVYFGFEEEEEEEEEEEKEDENNNNNNNNNFPKEELGE